MAWEKKERPHTLLQRMVIADIKKDVISDTYVCSNDEPFPEFSNIKYFGSTTRSYSVPFSFINISMVKTYKSAISLLEEGYNKM